MRRVLRVVIGLCLAVMIAALALVFPVSLTAIFREGADVFGTFYTNFTSGLGMVLLAAGLPMINFAILSEWLKWRRRIVHVGTGFVIGSALPAFATLVGGDPLAFVPLSIWLGICGAAGAYAYWLVAGRNAGCWREEVTAPGS